MNFVQLSVEMVSKITLCSQSKVTVKVILLMFCSCLDDHPPNSIVFMLRFEIRVQGALSCLALAWGAISSSNIYETKVMFGFFSLGTTV